MPFPILPPLPRIPPGRVAGDRGGRTACGLPRSRPARPRGETEGRRCRTADRCEHRPPPDGCPVGLAERVLDDGRLPARQPDDRRPPPRALLRGRPGRHRRLHRRADRPRRATRSPRTAQRRRRALRSPVPTRCSRKTWEVGTQEVAPGGGIAVPRHFIANYGAFQTDDPGGDNLVSIASSSASVRARRRRNTHRRHARRLPRGGAGAFLPPGGRPARARRHGDGHLWRPIRRRARPADAELLQRPHALPPLRRLRAGWAPLLPADPAHSRHRHGTRRRARLRAVGGPPRSVVRPGRARRGPLLQPGERALPGLARTRQRRTHRRACRRRRPDRRARRRAFRRTGRLSHHHRLRRRQHRRRREPHPRLPGRFPRLLGRHPRPLRLRRRDRHAGPLHDLGEGRRPAGFRDPLGTRHLDRRLRVGGAEAQRRHLLRGRTLHRLSRLRVEHAQPVRRTPQRALPHATGPPAGPDPVLPDAVGPVCGTAQPPRPGGRGGDPPRAPVGQLPPGRPEAAAAHRDHVAARHVRVVRPGVPAPWPPGRLHRRERQPPGPARLHGAARWRPGTAGRPGRGTRRGVVPGRAVRLPEGGAGVCDHRRPHHSCRRR